MSQPEENTGDMSEEESAANNLEETVKIGFEDFNRRLEKAHELQREAQECVTDVVNGMDNILQHVDSLKEFIELYQGPTIDFPHDLINEFNECLEIIIRICNSKRVIGNQENFSMTEKMKQVEGGIEQIKCIVEDLKPKVDELCMSSTH